MAKEITKYKFNGSVAQYYFECACHLKDHLITATVFENEDEPSEFYIELQLDAEIPWYRRIWKAIKYIFGRKEVDWSSTMLEYHELLELRKAINYALESWEKHPKWIEALPEKEK